jgi:DNA-binding NarL/FixJ family response regulator
MVECCRVLIADDNMRARFGLRVLLALSPEVEVVGEAANGLEVVEQVQGRRPDVVLMDVRMPLLDGLAATRQMKARWPDIRIVLTSMVAGHRAEALAAGADAFLVKGSSIEELRAAILRQAIPDP